MDSKLGLGLLARVGPEGFGRVAPGQCPSRADSPPREPVISGMACGRPGHWTGVLLPAYLCPQSCLLQGLALCPPPS